MNIAVAQSISVRGNLEANIANHKAFVEKAVRHGCQLIVFPELSLTGYELDLVHEFAFRPNDKRFSPLQYLADLHGISIVVGAPIVYEESKLFIAAVAIRPNSQNFIYSKQNLYGKENAIFTTGSGSNIIEVNEKNIALSICADASNPVHAQKSAERSSSIYASGVLVSEQGYQKDTDILKNFASNHSMGVLMANHGGPTGGWQSAGKSAIWDDTGQLLVSAEGIGNELLMSTIGQGKWSGKKIKI